MDMFQAVFLNEKDTFASHVHEVDINIIDEFGRNLLHVAIAYDHNEIAAELIRRGIDVNRQDSRGQTPLHAAAWYQNVELTRLILENGGDVAVKDVDGNTPLWAAVINPRRDYRVVELLRQHGADSRDRNNYGKSPLEVAEEINESRLVALLS